MWRRIVAVVAVVGLALGVGAGPAWADHDTAHTIEQMTAHYRDPGLEVQNRPFALLYLRTTEGMRDANAAGEFSAPEFWDREVIPTFAAYYLDAYAAWERHRLHDVPPAWRIAFRTKPERLTCTQMIYLGISAHINNDLAFMIEEMGPGYTYADHKHVDDVLVFRTRPVVYPEIQRDLCPGLFGETVPPTADVDIFAWRELAWRNGQALLAAPDERARDAIARQIRDHARDQARAILRWHR
ncbi:DUF5995 family protein [Asanoa sp. WMMD1127]|uniref:DUF5995 family protein n=1 Tax=Asanoa sp. WMMD1127 TaxID=3016107 RepID=UPI00241638F1|nr:DUF5995 family protein [Asanoa sp. WMMD1127]MDG4827480.1 DUF5995 family protein [Asanoa sp. WMMD1127]